MTIDVNDSLTLSESVELSIAHLIGHWVAADAGGSGSILPDRSSYNDDGTLTGGCTWATINGEAALNCPASDYAEVTDYPRWDLVDFTFIVRMSFNDISSQPGWLSHSPGSGFQPKWIWQYGYGDGASGLHWDGDPTVNGSAWTPSINTIYALGVKRKGSDFTFFRDEATDGTASTADPFDDASATLKIGWGGEAFFNSDVKIISVRMYDGPLQDQKIFDLMALDAIIAIAVNVNDDITISELIEVVQNPINIDCPDAISIDEFILFDYNPMILNVNDSIVLDEFILFDYNPVEFLVSSALTLADTIIVITNPIYCFVFSDLILDDSITLQTNPIHFSVNDVILISDEFGVLLPTLLLNVIDTLTFTEDITSLISFPYIIHTMELSESFVYSINHSLTITSVALSQLFAHTIEIQQNLDVYIMLHSISIVPAALPSEFSRDVQRPYGSATKN